MVQLKLHGTSDQSKFHISCEHEDLQSTCQALDLTAICHCHVHVSQPGCSVGHAVVSSVMDETWHGVRCFESIAVS